MFNYSSLDKRQEDVIPTNRFEPEQHVRVQLQPNRTEIGEVVSINEEARTAVVSTRHGYDVTVKLKQLSRAFLLVLDLNGVLASRSVDGFVRRPHVEEFLRFAMNNFVVAVWTSGMKRTSDPMVDDLFSGYKDRLLFTWNRDECTMRPTPERPYGTIKDLQRIFDKYPKSFHTVNTIIVDDSPEKCSHPDVALCPVQYKDVEAQRDDDGLIKAEAVLRQVLEADSLRPLIHAAEERLEALGQTEQKPRNIYAYLQTLSSGSDMEQAKLTEERDKAVMLMKMYEWKLLLCCHHIRGGEDCKFGTACRYSHDPDDGVRPCSRQDRCVHGHAERWEKSGWYMTSPDINGPRSTSKPEQPKPTAESAESSSAVGHRTVGLPQHLSCSPSFARFSADSGTSNQRGRNFQVTVQDSTRPQVSNPPPSENGPVDMLDAVRRITGPRVTVITSQNASASSSGGRGSQPSKGPAKHKSPAAPSKAPAIKQQQHQQQQNNGFLHFESDPSGSDGGKLVRDLFARISNGQ